MAWYVGIDWATRTHAGAVVGDDGTPPQRFTVRHTGQDLAQLVDRLATLAQTDVVPLALERPEGRLARLLLATGHPVHVINPKAVTRYRDRWSSSGAKADPTDAEVLAHVLRTDLPRHPALPPSRPAAQQLARLVRDRPQGIALRTQRLNQLRAKLEDYYPAALTVFANLAQPITLAFLAAYPSPPPLAAVTETAWRAFLRQHRSPHARAPLLWQRVQAAAIPDAGDLSASYEPGMRLVLGQLQALLPSLHALEQQIARVFQAHPDAPLFASLPGAGPVIAAELLAGLGDARARYTTVDHLRAEAGPAPVTRQSGTWRAVPLRRACNRRLRQTFQQLARQRVRQSAWARASYDAHRPRGQSASRAARGLADQWLRVVWRMWIDRPPYDATFHLARWTARQAPKAA